MFKHCLVAIVGWGLVAVAAAAEPVESGSESVSAEELIASVPVLSSDDESLQSFELTGVIPSPAAFCPIRMELSWQRGGQLSV